MKFFFVVNIVLSITAFLGNNLILAALHKESSLHPPSKLLYRNLAATDLCVGIIAEPLCVAYLMSVMIKRWNICRYLFVVAFTTGYILASVSLFTLTAISVDRLLALLSGLKYKRVVTLKRTYLTVIALWAVSIGGSTMHFWNNDILVTKWYGNIAISSCLIISFISYAKIFLTLRRRQIQVQDNVQGEQPSQRTPLNIARYKKAVSSALWVQSTLVVCYLPDGIMEVLLTQKDISSFLFIVKLSSLTLVYFNSSLNPILYCWKIKEVKQAVKETIRQLWCSPS